MYKPRTAREVVIPRNRVEVDLYVCQMQQRTRPSGCANCHRMVSKLMVSQSAQSAHFWMSCVLDLLLFDGGKE